MFTTAMAKIAASEKSITGPRLCRRPDHHEDAEDHLEHQFLGLALAEEIGPGLEAVIGPCDHRREGKEHHGERQDIGEPAILLPKAAEVSPTPEVSPTS